MPQIFFVVTLESGRVKPDDLTTIKLVLDAAEMIGHNQYSILVNKVSPELEAELEDLQTRNELEFMLVPSLFRARTNKIYYFPVNMNLVDQTNKGNELDAALLQSFIDTAPEIIVPLGSVPNIQFGQYEDIFAQLREEIAKLKADNAELRKLMKKRDEEINEMMKKHNMVPALGTHEKPLMRS